MKSHSEIHGQIRKDVKIYEQLRLLFCWACLCSALVVVCIKWFKSIRIRTVFKCNSEEVAYKGHSWRINYLAFPMFRNHSKNQTSTLIHCVECAGTASPSHLLDQGKPRLT